MKYFKLSQLFLLLSIILLFQKLGNAQCSSCVINGNVFFGQNAGISIDANTKGNIFFGFSAGLFTEGGSGNSIVGFEAGRNNKAGSSNSFFGYQSGYSNDNALNNSFFWSQHRV